ncbi:MAG: hypothetical protein Tsb0015_00970 [Simkaniaceae bacterium]
MEHSHKHECEKEHAFCDYYKGYQGLGKWYSWDTPVGLGLGLAIFLSAIGFFIFLLHKSGLF